MDPPPTHLQVKGDDGQVVPCGGAHIHDNTNVPLRRLCLWSAQRQWNLKAWMHPCLGGNRLGYRHHNEAMHRVEFMLLQFGFILLEGQNVIPVFGRAVEAQGKKRVLFLRSGFIMGLCAEYMYHVGSDEWAYHQYVLPKYSVINSITLN